ncbi:unnamed protein product [Ectocarpus sp. 6 AP-2014]
MFAAAPPPPAQMPEARALSELGKNAILMLAICGNLAWTALYVNSDSQAAAIFPLLLGLALLQGRPDESGFATTSLSRYIAFAWGVTFAVGVFVCILLARAVEGIALDVQVAASNGEVSPIKLAVCGVPTTF